MREKKRRRTANGRTMCVVLRSEYHTYSHTYQRTHLRPYLHTRWVSKQASEQANMRANKTQREKQEKDKRSCGMNHLILLGTQLKGMCNSKYIYTRQSTGYGSQQGIRNGSNTMKPMMWCDDSMWKDASERPCFFSMHHKIRSSDGKKTIRTYLSM